MDTRPRVVPEDDSTWPIFRFIDHIAKWTFAGGDEVFKNPSRNFPHDLTDDDVVIYCVHGTADRSHAFTTMAGKITHALPNSIPAIYSLSFENRFQGISIEDYANQLLQTILANKHKNVILMGHSRGGLVIAYLIEFLAKKYGINVIQGHTFGTPYRGSNKAIPPLTLAESVAQMQIGSPFLANLCDAISKSEVDYHFWSAERDEFVTWESACVPGMEHKLEMIMAYEYHVSMLSSNQYINSLVDILHGKDCSLTWQRLQSEVERYINLYKKASHTLFPAEYKLKLLESLKRFIDDRIKGVINRYEDAKTIGEFLEAYSKDTTLLKNAAPVLEALNLPLNSLASAYNASTGCFLSGLCLRYKNVDINAGLEKREELKQELQRDQQEEVVSSASFSFKKSS